MKGGETVGDLIERDEVERVIAERLAFVLEHCTSRRRRKSVQWQFDELLKSVRELPVSSGLPAGLVEALNSGQGVYRP